VQGWEKTGHRKKTEKLQEEGGQKAICGRIKEPRIKEIQKACCSKLHKDGAREETETELKQNTRPRLEGTKKISKLT